MHAPGKAAQGRGEQKQPCPSQEDAFATVKIGEASINRDRHRLGQRSQHDAVNAAEAIELLPGSHAKPARSRLGLRVHERAPFRMHSLLSRCRNLSFIAAQERTGLPTPTLASQE